MNKKLIISALCILMFQVPNATFSQETNGEINVSQKTTMQKIKRGADKSTKKSFWYKDGRNDTSCTAYE